MQKQVLVFKHLLLAAWLAGALPAVAWAQIPRGGEFRVNAYTTDYQLQTSKGVASDASGNFVVVWQSYGQDGSETGVFARRFLASGAPIGTTEFRVNAQTASYQRNASVASDPTGRLVVVWESNLQDGNKTGIFGRRYDAAGTPGPEFRVNVHTTSYQNFPSVAMDDSGNFVVVWQSAVQDGSERGIFARRYNAAGVAQGGEFQVNSHTTDAQTSPSVAMTGTGNFVVVWRSDLQDGSAGGIFGQRYDASGVPQGSEFQVSSYTMENQYVPDVAMDADGDFVVVWNSFGQDGQGEGVFGQRYDASGLPQGGEFRLNSYTTGRQMVPFVDMDAGGNFVVGWSGESHDGSDWGAVARVFDASGTPSGGEFVVNSYTTGLQAYPSPAFGANGTFVVAWTSLGNDGDSLGMFGQQFATDLIFRDGFESGDLLAWSSSATDGGDLSVSSAAAMKFTTAGLQGVIDDRAGLYVQDDSPTDENRYRARFYFDTNSFDPGEASGARRTRMFIAFEEAPTRRLAAVVLRRLTGAYSVRGRARLDDDSQADTPFFPISPGSHFVELDWTRASGPDANDGRFELWIDGNSVSTLGALDNSRSGVDFVRLGALSVKDAASGTLYWDEFESRRLNAIGP